MENCLACNNQAVVLNLCEEHSQMILIKSDFIGIAHLIEKKASNSNI